MTQAEFLLERVAGLADELKLANLVPQIAACRNLLRTTNGIDVAVFGRFKAGKSSFLNHLVGRPVLPIGVVPLTAVITRLRAGPVERAQVRFLNGTIQTISLDDIRHYVAEIENPDNTKHVASVEVELPALEPLAPLEFVDTPGLGSAFTHNTEAALRWLPNVGAALVAVSADAPLSERDLALLEELRRHTPKIVLLLTKADLLTEPQRAEVMHFVTAQLCGKWDGGLPAFFYSIKAELAGLKRALLAGLLEPLRHHRDEASGEILRHKLASLRDQTLNYLRVALAAATAMESARKALDVRLEEERRHFEQSREELRVLTQEWSAKALDDSLKQLQPALRVLQSNVTEALPVELRRAANQRLPVLIEVWREWLQVFLGRALSELSHSERAMFCEPVQKAGAHLTRSLRAFHDRLAAHAREALEVTLTPREFTLEVREPTAPPVDVNYAFDAAFSMVGWLIPLTLFRRPVERVLLRKARYEVEKNLSRLAAEWRDRVAVAIEELCVQAERSAREELAVLARMLAQTNSDVPRLREQIAELEAIPLGARPRVN